MATTATFTVSGMTCEHCVSAVSEEVAKLAGVRDVAVELVPEGTSAVTVTSEGTLATEDIREAVDEAGYQLVEDR